MADDSSEDAVGAIAPILKISPTEISFAAPFSKAPEVKMILLNPSDDAVAFKIKTTAPKRYCVRPNLGLVMPKDKMEIQVILNPTKDPIVDYDKRDKFQLLSTKVKDASKSSFDVKDLFDGKGPQQLMKQKMKCSFKPPPGTAAPQQDMRKKTSSAKLSAEGVTATPIDTVHISAVPLASTVPAPQSASAPAVAPAAAPQTQPTHLSSSQSMERKASVESNSQYSSAMMDSSDAGLRQRSVDTSSKPTPATATPTPTPTQKAASPVASKANQTVAIPLPFSNPMYLVFIAVIIFLAGVWAGISLNRVFS